jgi:hypothetical protein
VILATKVWALDECEPPGQASSNLEGVPRHWFREDPAYAAELYALERWGKFMHDGTLTKCEAFIYVLDTRGDTQRFTVHMAWDLAVKAEPTRSFASGQ